MGKGEHKVRGRSNLMTKDSVTFEQSSGNVFADLGIPDADEHLVKADLASHIRKVLQERGLTQTEAAKLLGTSQARVSEALQRQSGPDDV